MTRAEFHEKYKETIQNFVYDSDLPWRVHEELTDQLNSTILGAHTCENEELSEELNEMVYDALHNLFKPTKGA